MQRYKMTFDVPDADGAWPQDLLDQAFERIHNAVLDEGFEIDDEIHEVEIDVPDSPPQPPAA